ncbi:uncharacterized protein At5g65660-like [Macadamia integrifolia]|uniref:uncharacterized protein At5g65660-like n=1 Tax=Macadamia integrifolia TaxID=60698 RepID=UPI001C4E4279|nr:uncharacterized protein At5g65660-like [Macadamia integrifolia]
MENQEWRPEESDASRPSIGFPLGTALLLIVIFCLSGFFSCCYQWDKLRSLRRRSEETEPDLDSTPQSPSKSKHIHMDSKQNKSESLPVVMPGDRIPKFIAMPCPCEPPRAEETVLVVHMLRPPPPPPRPRPPLPIPYYI